MIEISRQWNTSIYMRFDDKGNDDLIKTFDEILEGKEVVLDVNFDMSVVKMKKRAALQRASTIHVIKDNEVDIPTIYLQDNEVIWKINDEDADEAAWRFKECKKQGDFGMAEFMCIQVPKNKNTDEMYCEFKNQI